MLTLKRPHLYDKGTSLKDKSRPVSGGLLVRFPKNLALKADCVRVYDYGNFAEFRLYKGRVCLQRQRVLQPLNGS